MSVQFTAVQLRRSVRAFNCRSDQLQSARVIGCLRDPANVQN